MLSGIKVGKKKKKDHSSPSPRYGNGAAVSASLPDSPSEERRPVLSGNAAVAAALQQQLAGGGALATEEQQSTTSTILLPDRTTATYKKEEDMTMQELLVHEKSHMSLAEQETRNILRPKKRRAQVDSDGDEVIDERQWQQPSAAKAARRDQDRQLAQHRRGAGVTQSCWWWVESTRFAPDRTLLAASANVTLILNTSAKGCLLPGKHFYLVPIPHASSWTACENNVWVELRKFQQSLRAMARAQDEAVLFWETALQKGGLWQTRMDVLFVPRTVAMDAPLYFRSALAEQAQEFGTHQQLMTIKKSLKASVPQNFSYFYVEYGEYDGHLQLIESRSFPSDFGVETIAGMMELDSVRLRSKKTHDDGQLKRAFLDKWAQFDWVAPSATHAT